MFTSKQQVALQTGIAVVVIFLLARLGGVDPGGALVWALVAGVVVVFTRRQILRVDRDDDVFRDTWIAESFPNAPMNAPVSAPAPSSAPAAPTPVPQAAPAPVAAPTRQDAPADDLKRISGIGGKIEEQLNAMGIDRFEQIAAWTPDDIARIDAALPAFKGRAERDDWIGQARQLASGS